MKRVKVMLMAIAVIALAAGTLAFKARYNVNFCTTAATTTVVAGQEVYTCTFTRTTDGVQTTLSCPNLTLQKTTLATAPTATICTAAPTIIDGDPTCANRICVTTTKLTIE